MTAHPMLAMLENSEQPLTTRYSRRLITMEKVAMFDPEAEQAALTQQDSKRYIPAVSCCALQPYKAVLAFIGS